MGDSGLGTAYNRIDLEAFGPTVFRGRKKKRLDPGDFVSVRDGFTSIDICHSKCSGKLIAIMSETWELPQETWETASLKTQLGGVPIKHDLHCIICDMNDPEWIYEPKKDY